MSRSELFRFIGLDSQKTLLIAGADPPFLKWIDIGIGEKTTVSGSIPDSGSYDVILYCPGYEPSDRDRGRMKKLISPEGSIWAMVKGEIREGLIAEPLQAGLHIVRVS